MVNKCKLCGKEGPPIYTSIDYKMVPLCLECYKKNNYNFMEYKEMYKIK